MCLGDNLDIHHLDEHLAAICTLITDYRQQLYDEPVVPPIEPSDLAEQIAHTLPLEPTTIEHVLDDVKQHIIPHCTKVGHPRFLAWMNNSACDAGLLGEILNVGLAQVPFTYLGGPAATVLEDIVVGWFGSLFGFPAGHGGTLVSGGTVANLTALAVAREMHGDSPMQRGLQHNAPPLTLYMSTQGHSSIERVAGLLGLGIEHIRRIPTDARYAMQTDALRAQLDADIAAGFRPFCVVAQAGAANTGAIDPLPALAKICQKYHLWLHVDAAYGGGAMLTEAGREKLRGIEHADSITTDPHKWFYMPVEAGLILIKDRAALFQTFSGSACRAYKGPLDDINYLNFGVQYARAARALKIWFALRVYGLNQLARCIEQNMALAQAFQARCAQSPQWEVLHPVELSIVCARYIPSDRDETSDLDTLQQAIVEDVVARGQALVTVAVIADRMGIRLCFANHRTTLADVDYIYEALTAAGQRLTIP